MEAENKYAEGQYVHAIDSPHIKLIIRRYLDRIYYCKIAEFPEHDDLVYFERQIEPDTDKKDTAKSINGTSGSSIEHQ
ncbi:MAG: hypothetical protein ACK5Z2_10180 [Bacteroidota bacterium]|jgi:hypothetical protein